MQFYRESRLKKTLPCIGPVRKDVQRVVKDKSLTSVLSNVRTNQILRCLQKMENLDYFSTF